jgi:hypothetical protein
MRLSAKDSRDHLSPLVSAQAGAGSLENLSKCNNVTKCPPRPIRTIITMPATSIRRPR